MKRRCIAGDDGCSRVSYGADEEYDLARDDQPNNRYRQ